MSNDARRAPTGFNQRVYARTSRTGWITWTLHIVDGMSATGPWHVIDWTPTHARRRAEWKPALCWPPT